jgi:basic membrane protein A
MKTSNIRPLSSYGLLAAALFSMSGCGKQEAEASAKTTNAASSEVQAPAKSEPLKVGVMMPGFPNDEGYMESAAKGIDKARAELGDKVKITLVDQVPFAKWPQTIQSLMSQNDLVVTVGADPGDAGKAAIASFPNKKFAEVGGPSDAAGNRAAYDPKQPEIAFVAGAVAALSSKTGKVQFIGGIEIPPIVNTAKEFANGAKYAKPSIVVLDPVYTGDFEDVSKAKEAALSGIARGADVHYQILNTGLKGLVEAAREKNTSVIGGPLPQACGTQPNFIAYTKSDTGAELRYAIDQTLAGTWQPTNKAFGLASDTGASGFTLCTGDATVQSKVDAIIADIKSGKIHTI